MIESDSTFGFGHPRAGGLLLVALIAAAWFLVSRLRRRREVPHLGREVEGQLRRLEALLDIAPIGILVAHDVACQTITGNALAASFLGVAPDRNLTFSGAAPGRMLYRALRDGAEVPADELPLQRAIATRAGITPDELEVVLPDGRRYFFYASAAPILAEDGTVTGAIAAFLNVTARRSAAGALRASEERLRLAMEAANLDSWEWDLRTGVVEWSDGIVPYLGPSPQSAQDSYERAFRLIHPDDHAWVQYVLGRAFWQEQPYHLRFRVAPPDGEERWVEVRGKVLRDDQGDLARMFGVSFDVTANEQYEQERELLIASERGARAEADAANRAKDEFFAMVTHELRSPMNAIRLWTGVLRRTPPGPGRDRGLDEIDRSVVAQNLLINDLLDVSRIAARKLQVDLREVDIGRIVADAVEVASLVAAEKEVRFEVSLASDVRVRGDAGRLRQVVSNLLSNAVKFSRSGGVVGTSLAKAGDEAVIVIRDQGEGIDPAFLPHVFEPFQQADPSYSRATTGLGLGLAIVHHLVEAHGGQIIGESGGREQGATFTVRLPLSGARPVSGPLEPPLHLAARQGSLAGIRVLVVDDSADARVAMTAMLRTAGAHATAVGSAEEAMRALEHDPADVLLADIAMPREDGFMLLRRVRALGPARNGDVPVAAVTAFGGPDCRQLALSQGFEAHLAKPVAPEDLVAMVAELAAKARVH